MVKLLVVLMLAIAATTPAAAIAAPKRMPVDLQVRKSGRELQQAGSYGVACETAVCAALSSLPSTGQSSVATAVNELVTQLGNLIGSFTTLLTTFGNEAYTSGQGRKMLQGCQLGPTCADYVYDATFLAENAQALAVIKAVLEAYLASIGQTTATAGYQCYTYLCTINDSEGGAAAEQAASYIAAFLTTLQTSVGASATTSTVTGLLGGGALGSGANCGIGSICSNLLSELDTILGAYVEDVALFLLGIINQYLTGQEGPASNTGSGTATGR